MADTPTRVTARLSRSARRAQLLAAAKAVFVTQGYHAAAMDDIAVEAGVSKPVLYQHFPSKLELYLALLGESAADMVRLVRAALAATSDNHERVDNAVGAYFSFVADNGQAYRLVFESDLRGQLDDVQHALGKLDSGSYGLCEVCGEAIPDDRLAALPATRFCMSHAG